MKTIFIFLSITLFSNFSVFAQFPINTIYPLGVIGYSEVESLLNKKQILAREHIKEVYTYQTPPEIYETFTSKKIFINKDGNPDSIVLCFSKSNKVDSGFCSKHYYSYDTSARLIEMKIYDAKKLTSQILSEYIGENEIKNTTVDSVNGTSVEYKFFNQKGQFIKSKQTVNGVEGSNNLLYYNVDGLLDSIQYENSNLPTNIFKRTQKGDLKIIEMETSDASFKWMNSSEQCIATIIATKNNIYSATGNKYSSKLKIQYYYNLNGTLSKVTEKTVGKPLQTTVYSYLK